MKINWTVRQPLILVTLFIFFSSQIVLAQYAESTWKFVPNLDLIGRGSFVEYDIDNDGDQELVYPSRDYQKSLFKILDYKDDQYKDVYVSPFLEPIISWMEIYDLDDDGEFLMYIMGGQQLSIFDFNSLEFIDTVNLSIYGRKFFFEDTDGDGVHEIIVQEINNIYILIQDGIELNSKSIPGISDIAIGDVDMDGENEIIIAGDVGYVLNKSDLSEEWNYPNGFGDRIEVKDIDNTGKGIIFGAVDSPGYVSAFDGVLQTELWQINVGDEIEEIDLLDINNDNIPELIIGKEGAFNAVGIYNITNQSLLWQASVPSSGVGQISLVDFDNSGEKKLIYGCGHTSNTEELLVVLDMDSQIIDYESTDMSGGFSFEIADMNDDETLDYVVCNKKSDSYNDGGVGFTFDGSTKNILFGPSLSLNGIVVRDVSTILFDEKEYLLFIHGGWLVIYDPDLEAIVTSYLISGNINRIGNYYEGSDNISSKIIIGRFDGEVIFLDFDGMTITEDWSIPGSGSDVYDYKTGNFDGDPADEIAILTNGKIDVYDMETHDFESEVQIPIADPRVFEVADIDLDNVLDILYYGENNMLAVAHFNSTAISLFPIQSDAIRAISAENLDGDLELEIAILSNERLSIYKANGDWVYTSEEITQESFSSYDFLEIADVDKDQHMEIAVGSFFGVYEFTVSEEYLDVTLPTVKSVFPIPSSNFLPNNTALEVVFSEIIDTIDLENHIEISDQSGSMLMFSTDFILSEEKLIITPQPEWTNNETLTITIKNTLTDPSQNPLDGNENGQADNMDDDYSWAILIGEGIDDIGPEVKNLSIPPQAFQGSIINLSGYATDSSQFAISTIAYVEYFLDAPIDLGNGIVVAALDLDFDELTEEFEAQILTQNLAFGNHTISVVAQDSFGNWGNAVQINFNIIEESLGNWTVYSQNLLNTGANLNSDLNFPLALKYDNTYSNLTKVRSSIVVENFLIYGTKRFSENKLICQDVHTEEVYWEKDYDVNSIYPVTFSKGYVFVQLGNHSDSKLVCYDIFTGEEIWTSDYSIQFIDANGPVIYEDKVYIIESDQETILGAYDLYSGMELWKTEIHDFGYDFWQPAIYNDTMYAYANNLVAMNPHTGEIYYSKDETEIPFGGFSVGASIVVDSTNNQIIISSNNYLHAFSLDTKELVWTVDNDNNGNGNFLSTPALYDGKIYQLSTVSISEYDAVTGVLLWQYDNLSNFNGEGFQPTVNANILTVSNGVDSWIFDRNTHELKLTFDEGGDFILSTDYLIHSSLRGHLRVFEFDSIPIPLSGTLEISQEINCFDESNGQIQTDISGSGNFYQYFWNVPTSSNKSGLSNLPAGTYNVTVVGMNADSIQLTIELNQPDLIELSGSQTPEINGGMNGTAMVDVTGGISPYDYVWEDFPNVNLPIIENLNAGNYEVTVVDNNGCEKDIIITVEEITALQSINNDIVIKIFPTVTSDFVKIESSKTLKGVTIIVYDLVGRKIQSQEFDHLDETSIPLEGNDNGYYFIHILNEHINIKEKIVFIK